MSAIAPDVRQRLLALEHIGVKLGLDQIRALLGLLARPDLAYRSIIVGGTNGKGSVAAMLERGLREAGYRTGRYTSPHLVDLEERFVVAGRMITPPVLDEVAEEVLAAARHLPDPPSFFEATTAMALEVFRRERVQIAVLEVGLGGRLDATNAVGAEAVALTSIDFDHEQYLGDTIQSIAREKAGVIKRNSVVVLGPNSEPVEAIVAETCRSVGAILTLARQGVALDVSVIEGRVHLSITTPVRAYEPLVLSLRGRHQADNALTAIRLLEELSRHDRVSLPPAAIRAAVEDVIWPARLELVRSREADVLIDGAHNPAGARALASYLSETYGRRLPIVIAVMRDKQVSGIVRALAPIASEFLCTAPASPRAMPPEELLATAAAVVPAVPAEAIRSPLDAVRRATALGSPVVVAGSLYLAGEVRAGLSS